MVSLLALMALLASLALCVGAPDLRALVPSERALERRAKWNVPCAEATLHARGSQCPSALAHSESPGGGHCKKYFWVETRGGRDPCYTVSSLEKGDP